MKTLYEYAKTIYEKLPGGNDLPDDNAIELVKNTKFDDILSDDDKCLKLIQLVLKFKSKVSRENRHRASHIFITWLLGIGLSQTLALKKQYAFGRLFSPNIWLQTAVLHDYGYLCEEVTDAKCNLSNIVGDFNLFTDKYDSDLSYLNNMSQQSEYKTYFPYPYDIFSKYFEYSKMYHNKNNTRNECVDHGIIGGCIGFRKYCEENLGKKLKPSIADMQIQKIACICAASHNIYKSSSKKIDDEYIKYKLYGLLSTDPIKVSKKHPLLLLLSLVDTIECTKRFSAKNNPKSYLIQKTTLKYVEIEIQNKKIIVKFEKLYEFICKNKSEQMKEELIKHIEGISKLNTWTDFSSGYVNGGNFEVAIAL